MVPLERWMRDRLQRATARVLLPGPPAGEARLPASPARPLRVLVLRYDMIGDLVLTTGAIRQIAASRPEMEVDVLARASVAPVLEHLPFIRHVIPFDVTATRRHPPPGLLARVRRQGYDVVVDGMSFRHATPTSSVLLLAAAGAPYRVGLASTRNRFLYNLPVDPVPARHYAEQCAILALPFGLDFDTTDWRPRLAVSNEERGAAAMKWSGLGRGLRLFVNITAADRYKEWPDERMVAVLRRVRADHASLRVIVSGAPDQGARLARVAEAAGVTWSTQPLRGAMALVATADLVLSPDTGIVHIAAAFDRPTVSLHKRNTRMWTPYRVPSRAVFSSDDHSVISIQTDEVTAAVTGLLDEEFGAVRA
jgi:lipopolysaccharide heptosyltransferase II